MKIFTCRDRFEDMMTCIYDAWEQALVYGHEKIRVQREPIYQPSMFDEYIHVSYDMEKVQKVIRSIKSEIGMDAYVHVYYASLSDQEDALQIIYNFLRVGFAVGDAVCRMLGNPHVIRMIELKRKVGNESHHFLEFARFTSMQNEVYICHLEPRSDVIMLVGRHFADRMPSEHWMIIDDNRKTACVHPKDGQMYLRYLTDEEFSTLRKTEDYEDCYTDMWRGFFRAISIRERENIACQRNMFPIWKRKHAVEFTEKP
ncbi:MAG: TIGR03915 family putative DNA repair protein [Eubacteriales bacterium]|nr:TIGR03915 family putative DNA repair protein [Lachnospiraceae bacterium]MDO5126605.1 TIGR03915 family putative DNA repair protein [Eubacteriales bacterium]